MQNHSDFTLYSVGVEMWQKRLKSLIYKVISNILTDSELQAIPANDACTKNKKDSKEFTSMYIYFQQEQL